MYLCLYLLELVWPHHDWFQFNILHLFAYSINSRIYSYIDTRVRAYTAYTTKALYHINVHV